MSIDTAKSSNIVRRIALGEARTSTAGRVFLQAFGVANTATLRRRALSTASASSAILGAGRAVLLSTGAEPCIHLSTSVPNQALQPTVPPPLRYGSTSAELGRWAPMKPIALAVTAFLLSACAAGGAATRGTPVQPNESFAGSYINIKAPASSGWLLTQSGGSGMTFGKEGPSTAESFIAGVSMFGLSPTGTPAEFEDLIRAGVRRDTPPERYEVQRELLKYTDERGYPCVRYQALSKDKQPRGSETPLLLALDGLYCRHPKRQDTGFAVIYSFRGKVEHPGLRSEAESFIQGTQVPEK